MSFTGGERCSRGHTLSPPPLPQFPAILTVRRGAPLTLHGGMSQVSQQLLREAGPSVLQSPPPGKEQVSSAVVATPRTLPALSPPPYPSFTLSFWSLSSSHAFALCDVSSSLPWEHHSTTISVVGVTQGLSGTLEHTPVAWLGTAH